MRILKRDGRLENLSFDKVLFRLKNLQEREPKLTNVLVDKLAQKVISRIYDGVSSVELDEFAAQLAIEMRFESSEYEALTTRIVISNLHKQIPKTFSETSQLLFTEGKVNEEYNNFVQENKDILDKNINYTKDYTYDYFAFKTLEKSYLFKSNGQIVECPQYLLMRTAVGVHYKTRDLENILRTYFMLSNKFFTHASPTLYNAGTTREQLVSCFLLGIEDSMQGIYKCIGDCALISKFAGGIGVHISNIRSQGSKVKGTNGSSDGIVKMLKVFESMALHANQGSRRPGSVAMYIEPWHADIFEFLELPLKSGDEKKRARDLFYALWVPDLFMKCVEQDLEWYLMSGDDCPGLPDVYGQEFENLYNSYVSLGKYKKVVKARDIWDKILISQIETGMPYMTYKDTVNERSNQKNIGTIKSSNLCVTGDTLVYTQTGYYPIKELVGKNVNVWNGEAFSPVVPVQTSKSSKVYSLKFNDGSELKCTDYHKFYLQDGSCVEAKNLTKDHELLLKPFGKMNCTLEVPVQFEHGWQKKGSDVPINSNEHVKLNWLSNLFESSITTLNAESTELLIVNIDKSFLQNVVYLLRSLGVNSDLVISEIKAKDTIVAHTLVIKSYDILEFLPKEQLQGSRNYQQLRLTAASAVPAASTGRSPLKLVSRYYYSTEPVYCFTEKSKGMGVFNGILTGNCNEINIYSDEKEYGCCNLASISLPAFVEPDGKTFNFHKLGETVNQIVINLNNIIDINYYPVPETEKSNKSHRPIGIGVQGFANLMYALKIPFESQEARDLNVQIFETIYYFSLKASNELAKVHGKYSTFDGSPFSKGIFQFDYCGQHLLTGRYNWDALRESIKQFGTRNSLLTACMPTASTSNIMNNFESFEPATHNIFTRNVTSGTYSIVNKYLLKDLNDLGIWNDELFNKFKKNYGSIQNIPEIPDDLKTVYKDVFEISQKALIDLSADRQHFIDQSQSLNIYFENPTIRKLTSMHFYGWKAGLKTGLYYLRSSSASDAAQFTVDTTATTEAVVNEPSPEQLACSLENRENCEMCSG